MTAELRVSRPRSTAGVGKKANAANQRIADAIGTQDADQDPGDEGDGDSASAA